MSLLFQKSPEAFEPRADLDEALTFHGLTRARMTAEVIRWLESIRLEDPETYNYLKRDPEILKDHILKWDFAFSTGMLTDYPKRRHWTNWMAFREFIQNALDVEEKTFGYKNIAIKVFSDALGVHIVDRGPGITLEAFRLGGSDKGCEERGYFGEGLKVAAAHFAGTGVLVYVFNRQGQAFKLCLSPGTNLLLVVLGRARYPPSGTEVILYGATIPPDIMKSTVFQEWMRTHPEATIIEERVFGSVQCNVPKPNFIIKSSENVDTLWVRDIVVNSISKITRKPSIFGYNLWWVPLEPNRATVASQTDLAIQAAKTYTADSILELLPRIVEIYANYAMAVEGFFETDLIDWWHASDSVKEAVADWTSKKNLAVTANEKAADWIQYMGVAPLIISTDELTRLFSRAPTAETKVIERALERIKQGDATIIPEEALTLLELSNLGACKAVLTYVQSRVFYGVKLPEIRVSRSLVEARGTQTGNKIYIERRRLHDLEDTFSTLYHEYCHYYGERTYGKAPDLSEAFQNSLTDVSGYIANAFSHKTLVWVYRRALNGGWKANTYKWHREYYVTRHRLIDEILDEAKKAGYMVSWGADWSRLFDIVESGARVWVSFVVYDRTLEPAKFKISLQNVRDVIPIDIPPSEEMYRKKVGELIDKITIPHGGHGIIFMYNPWLDKYEPYRRF